MQKDMQKNMQKETPNAIQTDPDMIQTDPGNKLKNCRAN